MLTDQERSALTGVFDYLNFFEDTHISLKKEGVSSKQYEVFQLKDKIRTEFGEYLNKREQCPQDLTHWVERLRIYKFPVVSSFHFSRCNDLFLFSYYQTPSQLYDGYRDELIIQNRQQEKVKRYFSSVTNLCLPQIELFQEKGLYKGSDLSSLVSIMQLQRRFSITPVDPYELQPTIKKMRLVEHYIGVKRNG